MVDIPKVEIPKYTVIQYIRNKKRIPIGVITAVKSECEYGFNMGYSLCNKKDRFNKKMALKIALGRANVVNDVQEVFPHEVRKMISSFVDRCKKYYKV